MAEPDKEDGEISPQSAQFEDQDGFIIDKTFSAIITDEDMKMEEAEAEAEAGNKDEKTSNWQKQVRKRLLGDTVEKDSEPQNKSRRTNSCFNCKGDHMIFECPEPKDQNRIRRNRNEFLSNNQTQNPGGRISKAVEAESKFKPGRLSQNLRTALRLGPDDIPEWVYRMRRMGFHRGYPPGYLKKALKHEFGVLKIFSDDTKNEPDEDVDEARPPPTVESNKVHFYMGFNKTYGALRDRERGMFEIPPFDVFCEMLQTEVTQEHKSSEKIRIREAKIIRKEVQEMREKEKMEMKQQKKDDGKEEEEDDVFVVDRINTENVEKEVPERLGTPEISEGVMGESISQYIGTPVISRRDASGIWIADEIPSLEAFAVGIVPFEAKEEDQSRGTFKKIMETLRQKK